MPVVRIDLSARSFIEYETGFLPPAEAATLQAELRAELAFEQRAISLFGRHVMQPRLIAWAGELSYRYSGQTLEPRAFTPALGALRARVRARVAHGFNHALVNRYRSGLDSMGMHSDDEGELGPSPVVASLSLGAERRFLMAPKRPKYGLRHELRLENGSLLVMAGDCQHEFRHCLPKDPRIPGERINVTFRLLLRPPDT
jgi:alkylated DNA repair dioxygenase AlkB